MCKYIWTWYRLYNFLLGGRYKDIIDLKYKKVWNVLFNNQIVFGDYSRTPSLVRSGTILRKIMTRASIRQGLLFQRYKRKLTRSVNAENVVRQASRVNASEGKTIIFFSLSIQTLI